MCSIFQLEHPEVSQFPISRGALGRAEHFFSPNSFLLGCSAAADGASRTAASDAKKRQRYAQGVGVWGGPPIGHRKICAPVGKGGKSLLLQHPMAMVWYRDIFWDGSAGWKQRGAKMSLTSRESTAAYMMSIQPLKVACGDWERRASSTGGVWGYEGSGRQWGHFWGLGWGSDGRGKFFMERVLRCWHRLPRESVNVPGGVQGQVGYGPGQPDLVVGNPAQGRGVGTG